MQRILLVDDETPVLRALQRALRLGIAAIEIESFEDPLLALARARDVRFGLVISDYRMPRMDGVAFLRSFRKIQPACSRMILSAQADFGALVLAINSARILRYIQKPWDNDELVAFATSALALHDRVSAQMQGRAVPAAAPADGATSRIARQERTAAHASSIASVAWNPDGSIDLESVGRIGP